MYSSDYEDHGQEEVTYTDEKGRSLACTIEYALEIDGQEYVLLLPLDNPVEIFTWGPEDDDSPTLVVEDESEIDQLFDHAKVVLQEQCLTLQRTAITLTVSGDYPWDEDLEDEEEDGEELDEEVIDYYEELATFSHGDRKYAIYAPLDPVLIPARRSEDGKIELLSEEQYQMVQPYLESAIEEQMFEDV